MKNLAHTPVVSIWTSSQYQTVVKRLIIAWSFWMLILLLGGGLATLVVYKSDLILINNLTILSTLTWSVLTLEVIAVNFSLYVVMIWFAIVHFVLLLPIIRNELDQTILAKKHWYAMHALLAIALFANGLLILYYLYTLNHFFNQNKSTNNQNQAQEAKGKDAFKGNHKIHKTAQKVLKNLERKNLIKTTSQGFQTSGIDIRKPQAYEQSSAQNLELDYPEIISTKDINDVVAEIKRSEQQLATLTRSINLRNNINTKKAKRVNELIDLKQEIIDVSSKLKNLQQVEAQDAKQLVKILQSNAPASGAHPQQEGASNWKRTQQSPQADNPIDQTVASESLHNIRSQTTKHEHFAASRGQDYKKQYELLKKRLASILQAPPSSSLPTGSDRDLEPNQNKDTSASMTSSTPKQEQSLINHPCCRCYPEESEHQSNSLETRRKSLYQKLVRLNWYELVNIARDLEINPSFKKRATLVDAIITQKLNY